jgi:hypothetical protein
MSREYPPDFWDWAPEARDAYFAEQARNYREKAGNGAAAEIPTRRPFGTFGTSEGGGFSETKWPDPKPLPDGLLPVAAFNPAFLPETIAPWVMDISDRMQCPPTRAPSRKWESAACSSCSPTKSKPSTHLDKSEKARRLCCKTSESASWPARLRQPISRSTAFWGILNPIRSWSTPESTLPPQR